MKKILTILAIAATVCGSMIAFDEDNTKLEGVLEDEVTQVAIADGCQQDYEEFYNDLAHLAQADVPAVEGDVTVE